MPVRNPGLQVYTTELLSGLKCLNMTYFGLFGASGNGEATSVMGRLGSGLLEWRRPRAQPTRARHSYSSGFLGLPYLAVSVSFFFVGGVLFVGVLLRSALYCLGSILHRAPGFGNSQLVPVSLAIGILMTIVMASCSCYDYHYHLLFLRGVYTHQRAIWDAGYTAENGGQRIFRGKGSKSGVPLRVIESRSLWFCNYGFQGKTS